MKEKIIAILKECEGEFKSGEEISKLLNVTRTSIWKYMKQLKEEGYEIESVSRKGYRLMSYPDKIVKEEVYKNLNTKYIGRDIRHYETIGSTNTEAKKFAQESCMEGLLVISEEQIKGKGRLGRTWSSPKGTGIWMSMVLKPDINPMEASKITQIGAAAVSRAIELNNIKNQIKWPNDIVVNGKKVCGILTEMSAELNRVNYIIIGIGINVNTEEFPEELKEMATSLKIESKDKVDRVKLIADVINEFEILYMDFIKGNGIKKSIEICKKNSALLNKEVKVIERGKERILKAIDIDDEGRLIVENESGQREEIISGEISVRGLYGYV